MQATVSVETQDATSVVTKAHSEELWPSAAFRHLPNVKTFDLRVEELGLRLLQQTNWIFNFEVYELATLNIDHDLAWVRTCQQNSFIWLPFGSLLFRCDLHQKLICYLNMYISWQQASVQRLFCCLKTRVLQLCNFIFCNLKHKGWFREADYHVGVHGVF